MSFVAGGIYKDENTFQATAAQASGSIMTLGCITVVLPAAYQGSLSLSALLHGGMDALKEHNGGDVGQSGVLFISRGTSIILLLIYALYLVFQLKTHAFLFETPENEDEEEEKPNMTPSAAVLGLLIVTVVTSFSADYLVGAIVSAAGRARANIR